MSTETKTILAESLTLPCGFVIPNRLCKSAMTEALADDWGRPSDKLCCLYERWSRGGSGLLITGNVQVDRRYVERPGNVCIDGPQDAEQIRLLKAYACACKKHGSAVFVQLGHAGRQSNGMINMSPVAPGNIRIDLPSTHFGNPTALTVDDILSIKQKFVDAAVVCKECGFDGIQLHSAHGYLLSSFLNPLANNRTELFGGDDAYGGSLENRSRLLCDIVRDVRAAVGPSYPIAVKLNSADFQQGGFDANEAVKVACMLEDEGIDLLEISGGNYESGIYEEAVNNSKGLVTNDTRKESTKKREAYFLTYAIEIKKCIKKLPILVTGGWRTKGIMEAAIRDGECSMIGLGRPLCGDPDGSKKLLNNEISELPRYEQQLRTGVWCIQWIFSLPIKLFGIINMVSQQAWYYRNIYSIGETGEPDVSLGCFASFLANDAHERALASNLKGDVKCTGSVYSYKGQL